MGADDVTAGVLVADPLLLAEGVSALVCGSRMRARGLAAPFSAATALARAAAEYGSGTCSALAASPVSAESRWASSEPCAR